MNGVIEAVVQQTGRCLWRATPTHLLLCEMPETAEESGAKLVRRLLYSASIGVGSDGDFYIKMVIANTRSIVEALGAVYAISAS